MAYKGSENKMQDWQSFLDVSNTKSRIADCRSLPINVRELNLVQLCLNARASEPI